MCRVLRFLCFLFPSFCRSFSFHYSSQKSRESQESRKLSHFSFSLQPPFSASITSFQFCLKFLNVPFFFVGKFFFLPENSFYVDFPLLCAKENDEEEKITAIDFGVCTKKKRSETKIFSVLLNWGEDPREVRFKTFNRFHRPSVEIRHGSEWTRTFVLFHF